MKTFATAVAVVLASTMLVGPTQAATTSFGLMGGMSIPISDAGDVFKPGFNGGVFGDYWVTPKAAIGLDILGNFHSAKDEFNDFQNESLEDEIEAELVGQGPSVTSDLETSASFIEFGVHGKFMMASDESKPSPFVQVGAGMYNIRAKVKGPVRIVTTSPPADATVEIDESESENKIGLSAGGGILFRTSPALSLGLAAMFHNVFTDESSTRFFNIGVVLTFSTSSP